MSTVEFFLSVANMKFATRPQDSPTMAVRTMLEATLTAYWEEWLIVADDPQDPEAFWDYLTRSEE